MLNLKAGNIIFGDPLCHDTLNGIRQRHISLENKSFGIYFTVNHARQIARLIPASSNVTNVANRSLNQFERKDVWRKKGRAREPMINFAPAETAKTDALFAASLRANNLSYLNVRTFCALCKTTLHWKKRLGYFITAFFKVLHERLTLKHQTSVSSIKRILSNR